jgi:nitroreductase
MIMLKIIKQRRSIRSYTAQSPTHEQLEAIIEAAGWAPSGMNHQSWQFMLLSGDALEYIRVVIRDYFRTLTVTEKHPAFYAQCKEWAKDDNYSFFYHAPALLVISNRTDYRNAMADSAAAAENAILEATDLGLASCWITTLTGTCDEPSVRSALTKLGLPDNYQVCVSIALGYGDHQPEAAPRTYQSLWVCQRPSN